MADPRKWKVCVDQALIRNPKFLNFARMIKRDEVTAIGHLVLLWSQTLEQCPSGELKGWGTKNVAEFSGWKDDPDMFVKALIECGNTEFDQSGRGFLTKEPTGYKVWSWADWQNDPVGKREKWAERQRNYAERKAELIRNAYGNNPEHAPGVETPKEQTTSRFIMLARRLKIPNGADTLRRYFDAWIAQGHAQKLEGILMDQKNAGYNVIQLQQKYFDAQKKEERNFTQEAIDAAKQEVGS